MRPLPGNNLEIAAGCSTLPPNLDPVAASQ
jgi:hypothetical protein